MKVLTLNVWNYHRPWRRRCKLIRQLIERERPDLVGLQEVCNDWWGQRARWNQAEQINSGLGYHVVFRPAATYWRFPLIQVGQAVLSRHPVREVESFPLSLDPDDPRDRRHPRSVLRAEVETAEGRVNFFVTHLSLSYHARNRSAIELWEFAQRCDTSVPQIVVGDFNAIPHQRCIRFLTGRTGTDAKRGDFVDAWAAVHPDDLGYTFRADQPMRRIDYIFVRGHITVADVRIVGDRPDAAGVYPSDHCGVVAEVELSQ